MAVCSSDRCSANSGSSISWLGWILVTYYIYQSPGDRAMKCATSNMYKLVYCVYVCVCVLQFDVFRWGWRLSPRVLRWTEGPGEGRGGEMGHEESQSQQPHPTGTNSLPRPLYLPLTLSSLPPSSKISLQGEVDLPFPRLNTDLPVVLIDASFMLPFHMSDQVTT